MRREQRTSAMNVEVLAMTPATMSEWPLRYFVALWTTTSKPMAAGLKLTGGVKVLSMTEVSWCSRQKATTALRSPTCIGPDRESTNGIDEAACLAQPCICCLTWKLA